MVEHELSENLVEYDLYNIFLWLGINILSSCERFLSVKRVESG